MKYLTLSVLSASILWACQVSKSEKDVLQPQKDKFSIGGYEYDKSSLRFEAEDKSEDVRLRVTLILDSESSRYRAEILYCSTKDIALEIPCSDYITSFSGKYTVSPVDKHILILADNDGEIVFYNKDEIWLDTVHLNERWWLDLKYEY